VHARAATCDFRHIRESRARTKMKVTTESIMNKFENVSRFMSILGACAISAALTGCATSGNIHFRAASAPSIVEAPRVAESPATVTVTSAQIVAHVEQEAAPAPAESIGIDQLPTEDVALLEPAHAHEFAESFSLSQHVPSALSFHCVSGEESLGCAAKPATPPVDETKSDEIERDKGALAQK
jgi:hypothetical protein